MYIGAQGFEDDQEIPDNFARADDVDTGMCRLFAVCCSVLQCVVVCCSVLQCVVACCSAF